MEREQLSAQLVPQEKEQCSSSDGNHFATPLLLQQRAVLSLYGRLMCVDTVRPQLSVGSTMNAPTNCKQW